MSRRSKKRKREPQPTPASPQGAWPPWPDLVLIAIPLIAFATMLGHSFTTWDDPVTLWRNPAFNPPTLAGIASYWAKPHMDMYIPVTYTVWGILAFTGYSADPDAQGAFLSPVPFLLANLALHIGSTVLVYRLVRRILAGDKLDAAVVLPSLLGALVFALHPMQVETVCWLSGTKDLLFALFSLLALWLFVARNEARAPTHTYAFATLAIIAALLSKPTAVAVPLVALLLDLTVVRTPWRRSLMLLAPWLALAGATAIAAKLVQPADISPKAALYLRPLVAADALGFYLAKLVGPCRLCIDYGRNPTSIIASGAIRYAWLIPLAAVTGVWLARKAILKLPIAAALFLLPLLPLLGFVPFDFQTLSTVADHYIYLPMLGVALAFAALLCWNRHTAAQVAGAFVVMLLSVGTMAQIRTWSTSESLFRHAMAINPTSWAASNNLAVAALDAGNAPAAIALASRAAAMKPPYPDLYITLGMAYVRTGDLLKALDAYNDACRADPANASALASAAAVTAQLGDSVKAMKMVEEALELDPQCAQAHMNHAIMLAGTGEISAAADEMGRAVELDPNNANSRVGLAALLSELGYQERALLQVGKALELRPPDPRAPALRDAIRARIAGGQPQRR